MPDSINKAPYQIGYSFRNPVVVRNVATAHRPYFEMSWAAKGPTQTKAELYRKGGLQRYPTIWRRAAKSRHIGRLGAVMGRRELPDFNELGAAPGPTDIKTTTDSTTRSAFGFLDNIIKTAGEVIGQRQQLEMAKAQAQALQSQQYPTILPSSYMPGMDSGIGWLGWTAIIGGLGAGVYFYSKR